MNIEIQEETNQSYDLIENLYSGTVQLEEVLHFLNLAYPKWKTNGELGAFAPEFVLWVLEHTESFYKSKPFLEYLKALYAEILEEYDSYKEEQAFSFDLECIALFSEDLDKDVEALNDEAYKAELNKFAASKREKIAFSFTF